MNWKLVILAGVLALVVGLVWRLPATVASGWVQSAVPNLTLAGTEGTALSGRAGHVLYEDIALEDVSWQLRPLRLLIGQVAVQLSTATDVGRIEASLRRGLSGNLSAGPVNGQASLAWLARRAGYTFVPLSGSLILAIDNAELDSAGQVQTLTGRVQARGLQWDLLKPPAPIGNFVGVVSGEAGDLQLTIEEADGPVDVEGQASLAANGIYRLDLRLRARAGADDRLKKLIDQLGRPDNQGWYPIVERGQL
ncbi:type II secretion system protein N [Spectribacter hydrogenoxidans]|uniref:Type II secretion system protein N n=1 Tax=Spectribacter hydrogenoxidans TaxID=3075608 RepID=A0ABU3C3R2_9GAMM|nr:type II secretion system protein N [Salinisphaera sp. W335]MDT0636196.1 type II secretion system protein N [Salinisphaera sp. W335]